MLAEKKDELITEKEYFEGEENSDIKHEYIEGYIYAMAGASWNHGRIVRNILVKLSQSLNDSTCEAMMTDMKVKVVENYYYPDVLVTCEHEENEYFANSPIIIVEVISKSTRKKDVQDKRIAYQKLPSLQEYILIEQDFYDVQVFRKQNGWSADHYSTGDTVHFESIDVSMTIEEIYDRVKHENIVSLLTNKE